MASFSSKPRCHPPDDNCLNAAGRLDSAASQSLQSVPGCSPCHIAKYLSLARVSPPHPPEKWVKVSVNGRHAGPPTKMQSKSSWWFQPNWKIWVKNGNLPQIGVNIKEYWKPHLENGLQPSYCVEHRQCSCHAASQPLQDSLPRTCIQRQPCLTWPPKTVTERPDMKNLRNKECSNVDLLLRHHVAPCDAKINLKPAPSNKSPKLRPPMSWCRRKNVDEVGYEAKSRRSIHRPPCFWANYYNS